MRRIAMTTTARVQRWRQKRRAAGKQAVTLWWPVDEVLRLADLALTRHMTISDLALQAFATVYPHGTNVPETVTESPALDAAHVRALMQQVLQEFFGDGAPRPFVPQESHVPATVPETPPQTHMSERPVPVTVSETLDGDR